MAADNEPSPVEMKELGNIASPDTTTTAAVKESKLKSPQTADSERILSDSDHVTSSSGSNIAEEDDEDGIDDHNTHISFRRVERVDVKVRDLTITVALRGGPWWWPFGFGFGKSKKKKRVPRATGDEESAVVAGQTGEENILRILNGVSADMPAGELVCILGSSGSGKVCNLV